VISIDRGLTDFANVLQTAVNNFVNETMGGIIESYKLRGADSGETVSVRYVEDGEEHYVAVCGEGAGKLYDQVLGRVIHALAAHLDNLIVDRYE
jgi:hypothetical protein